MRPFYQCMYISPLLLLLLFITAWTLPAYGVTRFGQYTTEDTLPAEFRFDDIWFTRGGQTIIPEVNLTWLTAVFDIRFMDVNLYTGEAQGTYEGFIKNKARELLNSNLGFVDYFYDPNLAEDACFFRVQEGITQPELKHVMDILNQDEAISYTHPTLFLEDRIYAFFNAFSLTWKTGVEEARKESVLTQAGAFFDQENSVYRVDVMRSPFFTALHLLSQDITVQETTPYLMELKPTIRAVVAVGMNGAHVGDTIPVTLSITFSERVSIEPSSLSTINLRPGNLQRELFESSFDPYDPAKAVMQSPVTITGRIASYAVGEFMLPSITINYSCPDCSGETVRAVATEPVPFKVSSLVPAALEENRLLMPTDPVPLSYRFDSIEKLQKRSLVLTIAGFAAFVLGITFLFVLWFRQQAGKEMVAERSRDEVLAEKLRLMLEDIPPAPHWKHLGEIGALVRQYIGIKYGIPTEHLGGSGNRLVDSLGARIPGNAAGPLAAILAAVDDAVARELEYYPDSEGVRRSVAHLLQVTQRPGTGEIPDTP
ncbi:MAG TPA: hypothetical protein PKJ77_06540 [Thermodesulfobacteriota bacterium]|nr:hypothetical protein [Thermodesulfobacteriota bacterium]HNU71105.1 hypothetical protein [Thermodesulfobacteriota bacterium]HOC38915.1 hypothetical protein [Thermodesulfobacteriota bacterium]